MDTDLIAGMIAGVDDVPAADLAEGESDDFARFQKDSKLAGYLGWKLTEELAAEAAIIEKNIRRRENSPAPAPTEKVNGEVLSKTTDKAVGFYLGWLGDRMATLHKSSAEIVEQWQEEFPDAKPEILASLKEAAEILNAA